MFRFFRGRRERRKKNLQRSAKVRLRNQTRVHLTPSHQYPLGLDPVAASSPWYLGKASLEHVELQLGLRQAGHFLVSEAAPPPDVLQLSYR